jgi:hypothetical protein
VRGPRPVEILVAVAVATGIGVVLSRKHPSNGTNLPAVDSGVRSVDAISDASTESAPEDAFAGWTVDDDEVSDPGEGTTGVRE